MKPQSSKPSIANAEPEPPRVHAGGRRRAGDGRARHGRGRMRPAVTNAAGNPDAPARANRPDPSP